MVWHSLTLRCSLNSDASAFWGRQFFKLQQKRSVNDTSDSIVIKYAKSAKSFCCLGFTVSQPVLHVSRTVWSKNTRSVRTQMQTQEAEQSQSRYIYKIQKTQWLKRGECGDKRRSKPWSSPTRQTNPNHKAMARSWAKKQNKQERCTREKHAKTGEQQRPGKAFTKHTRLYIQQQTR